MANSIYNHSELIGEASKKSINVELKKVTAVIDAGETLFSDEQSIVTNLFIERYGSLSRHWFVIKAIK